MNAAGAYDRHCEFPRRTSSATWPRPSTAWRRGDQGTDIAVEGAQPDGDRRDLVARPQGSAGSNHALGESDSPAPRHPVSPFTTRRRSVSRNGSRRACRSTSCRTCPSVPVAWPMRLFLLLLLLLLRSAPTSSATTGRRPSTKLSKLARDEGIKSFICLPLTSHANRLGVIYFYRTDRDTFDRTRSSCSRPARTWRRRRSKTRACTARRKNRRGPTRSPDCTTGASSRRAWPGSTPAPSATASPMPS